MSRSAPAICRSHARRAAAPTCAWSTASRSCCRTPRRSRSWGRPGRASRVCWPCSPVPTSPASASWAAAPHVEGIPVRRPGRAHRTLTYLTGYLSQSAGARLPARMTVAEVIGEPITSRDRRVNQRALAVRVATLLDELMLPLGAAAKYPVRAERRDAAAGRLRPRAGAAAPRADRRRAVLEHGRRGAPCRARRDPAAPRDVRDVGLSWHERAGRRARSRRRRARAARRPRHRATGTARTICCGRRAARRTTGWSPPDVTSTVARFAKLFGLPAPAGIFLGSSIGRAIGC